MWKATRGLKPLSSIAQHFAQQALNVSSHEVFTMGTHYCVICSEPVDLTVDPCDETGDPVHKHCYVMRMTEKSETAIPLQDYRWHKIHP